MNDAIQPGFYANASQDEIMDALKEQGYQPLLITEDPETDLEEHQHEQSHIIVVTRGEMELTLDGRTLEVHPGDLVNIPPRAPHAAHFGASGCEYVWVEY